MRFLFVLILLAGTGIGAIYPWAMSIYHHFPSLAHLHEALVDRLIGALEMPDASLPWRQRMRMVMQDFRRIGREQRANEGMGR